MLVISFDNSNADNNSSCGMVVPPTGATRVFEARNLTSTDDTLSSLMYTTAAFALVDGSQNPTR